MGRARPDRAVRSLPGSPFRSDRTGVPPDETNPIRPDTRAGSLTKRTQSGTLERWGTGRRSAVPGPPEARGGGGPVDRHPGVTEGANLTGVMGYPIVRIMDPEPCRKQWFFNHLQDRT